MRKGEKPRKIQERLKVDYGEDIFEASRVCQWACEPTLHRSPKKVKITGRRLGSSKPAKKR